MNVNQKIIIVIITIIIISLVGLLFVGGGCMPCVIPPGSWPGTTACDDVCIKQSIWESWFD
jgi:hypothetical protein